MEDTFIIPASISKRELALHYAPDLTPHGATNRLLDWLKRDEPTMQRLYEAGYRPKQKFFTSRQIRIIFEFLGEP